MEQPLAPRASASSRRPSTRGTPRRSTAMFADEFPGGGPPRRPLSRSTSRVLGRGCPWRALDVCGSRGRCHVAHCDRGGQGLACAGGPGGCAMGLDAIERSMGRGCRRTGRGQWSPTRRCSIDPPSPRPGGLGLTSQEGAGFRSGVSLLSDAEGSPFFSPRSDEWRHGWPSLGHSDRKACSSEEGPVGYRFRVPHIHLPG